MAPLSFFFNYLSIEFKNGILHNLYNICCSMGMGFVKAKLWDYCVMSESVYKACPYMYVCVCVCVAVPVSSVALSV